MSVARAFNTGSLSCRIGRIIARTSPNSPGWKNKKRGNDPRLSHHIIRTECTEPATTWELESVSIRQDVHVLFDFGATGALTDAELIERFRDSRGQRAENAFAVLMERHAGMVLRVCRSILRDENDAFDAVQATFLVLFRRAGSLRIEGSAAPWLHGVALRTARCSRRSSAIRLKHESRWRAFGGRGELKSSHADDLAEIVHQEIERLPTPFRQAVERLGWPLGTLQSRLSRGRDKLRTRLRKRGVAPDGEYAGLLGFLPTGTATVPQQVLQAVTSGAASSAVFALSKSMEGSLLVSNLRVLVAVAVLTAGVSAGVTWAALRVEKKKQPDSPLPGVVASKPPEAALSKEQQAIKEGPPPEGETVVDDKLLKPIEFGTLLRIDVLEALPGRRIEGIRKVRPDGTISLGFYGDLYVKGLNRNQVKVKVIEQLRHFISDEALGLAELSADSPHGEEKYQRIDPLHSTRVFVEEDPLIDDPSQAGSLQIEARLNGLSSHLLRLEQKIDALSKPPKTQENP